MRVLFLLLVLANIAFFAWAQYFSSAEVPADTARRNEPDKLKIVPPAELAARDAPKPAEPKPVEQKPAEAKPAALIGCLEWGSFTPADYARAEKALEPLSLGNRVTHRRGDDVAGWWVFIPPQPTRQAALRKAAELKALGVENYHVVNEEGDFRWALSLGVFRTEQAASARLNELREQGVRSAVVGTRDTAAPRLWLQMRGIEATLEPKLKEIARNFDGSQLRPCG